MRSKEFKRQMKIAQEESVHFCWGYFVDGALYYGLTKGWREMTDKQAHVIMEVLLGRMLKGKE